MSSPLTRLLTMSLIQKMLSLIFLKMSFIRQLFIYKKLKFPTAVEVELTNFCTASCIKCPHKNMKREKGYMNLELFKKIVYECGKYNLKRLELVGFGEPLMHKQFLEFLKIARKNCPKSYILISTNASLLKGSLMNEIIQNKLLDYIHISFDGAHKETYEKNMPPLKYDDILHNIRNLLAHRKYEKPQITIGIIETTETIQELDSFYKMWKKYNVNIDPQEYDLWSGNVEDRRVRINNAKRTPCYKLWSDMIIRWNGDVSICCIDYENRIVLDNVRNQSIQSVWNSKRLNNIRKIHLAKKFRVLPICNRCTIRYNPLIWFE